MRSELLFSVRKRLMQAIRLVWRPPLPSHGQTWLHLGCGRVDKPGFINIDAYPRRHVHYIRPIDDLSPFRDSSVDFIYVSHALEHFGHREVLRVLREWARVLRPGGRLCISVPDFDKLLVLYEVSGHNLDQILAPLMGGQEYRYDFHYDAFNERRLTRLLEEAGFENVVRWIPGADELHDFDDWSRRDFIIDGTHYPISLNLEARRRPPGA
ncbi:MAG: hypothetical protein OHK0026_02570 [Rhodocyclaceae bacterium]